MIPPNYKNLFFLLAFHASKDYLVSMETTKVLALVLLVGGCTNVTLPPRSAGSICPSDTRLDEAAARAVAYWNAAGAALPPPCTVGVQNVSVDVQPLDAATNEWGRTWRGPGIWPSVKVDPYVAELAISDQEGCDLAAGLVAHELGHALGLEHQPGMTSIMFAAPPAIPANPFATDVSLMAGLGL